MERQEALLDAQAHRICCTIASVGEVELTAEVWHFMRDIARRERSSLNEVFAYINAAKPRQTPLATALTLFSELYFKEIAAEQDRLA